jgi:ASPM-SPD-2-Hydin domain-containing protein
MRLAGEETFSFLPMKTAAPLERPIRGDSRRSRCICPAVLFLAAAAMLSCGGGMTSDIPNVPVVSLSASSLTFSGQSVGTTSPGQNVEMTNTGNALLASITIATAGDFSQTHTCGTSLAPGAKCVITVTFAPTTAGERTGLVTISDNAAGQPQQISLSGTGNAPIVQLTPASLSFSGQVVGSTSPEQVVVLTNTGNETLSILGISTSSQFAYSSCGTTVLAGRMCLLDLSFTPTAGGEQTGFMTITDNAPGSPHTVNLTGFGMANLLKLSTDTFTNLTSQHATEVEPETFVFGSTLVAVFQVGRFFDGGSSDIGFATSTDGGSTWQSGFLPGITNIQNSANPYDRVSDPAVAYDAAHQVWLLETLPILSSTSVVAPAVLVSRSADGLTWDNPVTITSGGDLDKPWITCDNFSASAFFGNCYVEWDAPGNNQLIQMSTSSDGGLTWSPALTTANVATGLGGVPLVQPTGTVVVPIGDANLNNILAFTSKDGGASWSSALVVSAITDHLEAGNLRSGPLPSAGVDASGNVYVVWQDCRFETNCAANDIVMAASADGVTWTPPVRIPIDPVTSGVDHFLPALAVDPATSGSTAHLGLTYYYYPVSNCASSTCELDAGFVSSQDGGATWSSPTQLVGPMNLGALPSTDIGLMVGDYFSVSYLNGAAHAALAVANPAAGADFDEAIYTPTNALSSARLEQVVSSAEEIPLRQAQSDHPPRTLPVRIR